MDIDIQHRRIVIIGFWALILHVIRVNHITVFHIRGSDGVGTRSFISSLLIIEVFPQACDARAREDAEDVPLMLVKFRGSLSAKREKFFAQERLNSSQAQMCEFRAVIEKNVYALFKSQ